MSPQTPTVRLALRKSDRMRFKTQFESMKTDGNRLAGSRMLVVTAPAENLLCAVICSKKYSLLSVDRNRARRLVWESIRLLKPCIKPCRLLVIPRSRMKKASRMEVTEELVALLKKQGLFPENETALP